ncbi:MAG TPA: phosphoribosyltransferase family protein, partial [Clostridiales bacterium]|nr:phosphoribosyltransferase family protein [Clostridiales bacterium]
SVCASHYYSEIAFDCVCFVPESEDVLKERGYNQSRLLAESVSRHLNVPCGELLKKLYTTKPQRTLSAAERQGNVLGVFETNPEEITAGKKILLIDDIKTTGATLDECAKSLLIAGADRVFCAVAAVSPMRASQNEETAEETLTAK